MYMPSTKIIAGILFVIAAILLALIFTHKSQTPRSAEQAAASALEEEHSVAKYIADVELKNELERDQIEQARKLAKQAQAKKDSVECQFWTQQKASKPTSNRKIDEKIAQFCGQEDALNDTPPAKSGT